MNSHSPIYNSRIIKGYAQYLDDYHADVDLNNILHHSGIMKPELEDAAHWFSQHQVDLFYKYLFKATRDRNLARNVGRYAVSSEGMGAAKQYMLGLISPLKTYLLMEKLYPILSRGAKVQSKKISSNKVKIISTPYPGVVEKPYQCENRLGSFEGIAKIFTNKFADIEHPACLHKGDEYCQYIISWDKNLSLLLKQIRNYTLLATMLGSFVLLFFLPFSIWLNFLIFFGFIIFLMSNVVTTIANKELKNTIETQGNAAQDLLHEMDTRYNNALLNQEIGHAASAILDIDHF